MATLIVLAIKDRAVDMYGRPIFMQAIGQAVRAFADEVNRAAPENQMYSHPDDFDLYELGTFDEHTGKFEGNEMPELVALGKQMKVRNES